MTTEIKGANGKAKVTYENELTDWIEHEKAAIELIGVIGHLWYEKQIELIIFRNQLVDRSASEIMKLHQYAKDIVKQAINVKDSLMLAKEIQKLDVVPSRMDIGRLASEWTQEKGNYKTVSEFAADKLKDYIGADKNKITPKDVVLYGIGRIGRLAARELISQAGKGEQLRLKAIVTRTNSDVDIQKRADLLRTDSVHGPFPGTVIEDYENKSLIINGHIVKMIAANKPEDIV